MPTVHFRLHKRTNDDGVVGDLLAVPPVVVEGQMPDPRVHELDEAGLMHVDGAGAAGRPEAISLAGAGGVAAAGLRVAEGALLLGQEPAAVQELHKVILERERGGRETRQPGETWPCPLST